MNFRNSLSRRAFLGTGVGLAATTLIPAGEAVAALPCATEPRTLSVLYYPAGKSTRAFARAFTTDVAYGKIYVDRNYCWLEVARPKSTFETDQFFDEVIYDMTSVDYILRLVTRAVSANVSVRFTEFMSGPIVFHSVDPVTSRIKLCSRHHSDRCWTPRDKSELTGPIGTVGPRGHQGDPGPPGPC